MLPRGPRPHRRVGVEDELLTGLVADSEALQDALLDELGDGNSRLGEGNVGPPQQVSLVTGAVATEESVHDPPDGARPVARGQVVVGRVRDDLVDEQVGVLGAARRTAADDGAHFGRGELMPHLLPAVGQPAGRELGLDLPAGERISASEELTESCQRTILGGRVQTEGSVARRLTRLDPRAGQGLQPPQILGGDVMPGRAQHVRADEAEAGLLGQHRGIRLGAGAHGEGPRGEGSVL